jgi:hypothetical protein
MPAPGAVASGASSILTGAPAVRGLALASALLLLAPGGDRLLSQRARLQVQLPPLMLWVWDRNDDLRFLDATDTGVAVLAATLTLRGDRVALEPRHNPIQLPERMRRAAVVHVETDRAEPPTLGPNQLRRFVEALAAVNDEVPNEVLQIDFEALASQRTFLIDSIAALRGRIPGAVITATALASWCANESWIEQLAADEVVPMLFRMGYDGRKVRAQLENGGDFRNEACRSSLGIATNELPAVLPGGRRIYVFNPRHWSAETYNVVRARVFR